MHKHEAFHPGRQSPFLNPFGSVRDPATGDYKMEIKARSLLGYRHIRHLIEHKLRGNPAHSLQHVAQASTDFQFARLNSSNRLAGKLNKNSTP
jgi:hypothetical protein